MIFYSNQALHRFLCSLCYGGKVYGSSKTFFEKLCVVLSVTMLGIILVGLGEAFFFHVAYYGLISTVLFLIYYYCSCQDMSRKDKIIMLFILSVGFLAHAPNFMDFMWPHCISFCGTNRDNCRK